VPGKGAFSGRITTDPHGSRARARLNLYKWRARSHAPISAGFDGCWKRPRRYSYLGGTGPVPVYGTAPPHGRKFLGPCGAAGRIYEQLLETIFTDCTSRRRSDAEEERFCSSVVTAVVPVVAVVVAPAELEAGASLPVTVILWPT